MASEAHGNVEKQLDAAREAELAAYIMRDVELRQQNARDRGVLAYGKKPIPRSIPNQRFLQNTLKSVDFANRSAREREMWQQWDAQKRPREEDTDEPKSKRKKARKQKKSHKERRGISDNGTEEYASDSVSSQEEIEEMMNRKPARGRGSTGPRADETGPFLFPTDVQEREEYELLRYAKRAAAGPECPEWIRGQNAADSSEESRGVNEPQMQAPKAAAKVKKKDKSSKESKSSKKEHKKKRRKPHRSLEVPISASQQSDPIDSLR